MLRSVSMLVTDPPVAGNRTDNWNCDVKTGENCDFVPLEDDEALLVVGSLIEVSNYN